MYFYNKARTALFWGGTALILYGVIAHVPMFIHAKSMGFRMVGMPMDNTMLLGMLGIFIGLASAFYGLMRPLSAHPKGILLSDAAIEKAINNKPIGRMQRLILVLLTAAIALDIMKPATLGLVIPGMRAEYGLTESQVFLLPLVALIGTTVGSILWGLLGDRMGRRAAILLSALMFIGTSVCGAMPTFEWNLVMCGLMGMSAGGLLPITFALIAEITPNSSRGWIMVLVGGTGTSIGYLAAVQNAALLEPLFSWRSLWFAGIPSGLLLIFLNKLIPESPRFLASQGRISEAKKTLAQFGIKIDDLVLGASAREIQQEKQFDSQQPSHKAHLVSILTMGLTLCGTAWGITNFGFLLWLPENLRASGWQTVRFFLYRVSLSLLGYTRKLAAEVR
jgi:MFS transporter, putative metabolite:H+ symporter